jgi:hypothetical protein
LRVKHGGGHNKRRYVNFGAFPPGNGSVHWINKNVLEFSDISGEIIEIRSMRSRDTGPHPAFTTGRGPVRNE